MTHTPSHGRENIMKEEKNPNIGTRFPEVTAQSLANTDEINTSIVPIHARCEGAFSGDG